MKDLTWPLTTVIIIISLLVGPSRAATRSAQTLRSITGSFHNTATSSTLAWETFTGDHRQLEYAVEGAKYHGHVEEGYSMFVCRAFIDGFYTIGQTRQHDERITCSVTTKRHFDILVNKGRGGKLLWKPWATYTSTPTGAVSVAENDGYIYVARHNNTIHEAHHEATDKGSDYHVGLFDVSEGLGRIIIRENNEDVKYDSGEILCETEPVHYDLRDIKFDKSKRQFKLNMTELASTTLYLDASVDLGKNVAESIITYNFDKIRYWGTHEGIARGLPTLVYDEKTPYKIEWGLKKIIPIIETKAVSTILKPGTAVNVTLTGNYVKTETPYTATLVAYYSEGVDAESRNISAVVQKADMMDVKIVMSPVYWIHNNSIIPTTTSTTSTTSTTTSPTSTSTSTSTSTKEPTPAHPPPIAGRIDSDTLDQNEIDIDSLNDQSSSETEKGDVLQMSKVDEVKGKGTSSGHSMFISSKMFPGVLLLGLNFCWLW